MPTIDTPGASLLYSRSGDGPPVLLIQGVGVVGNGWTPQVEGLRGRFTLVSFDNRGIGASVNRDGRLTINEMAADALAILDAEGIDRVHVAGHSMGGVIAQALALRAPARIKSLAFLCTFAKGKDGSKITLPMLATALRMRIGTRAMRRDAFLELIMPKRYLQQIERPALAARLAPLFGHDLAEQPPIVMKQLGAMSKYDAGARLAGRLLRGRVFLPGVAESDNAATGVPSTTYINDINGSGSTLVSDANTNYMVWSPTHGVAASVVTVSCWTKWAVLRSRRD
jgi:pimeloyl-ACP methyl ester carboxylesterase